MPLVVPNLKVARFRLTAGGLGIAAIGLAVWLVGDMERASAEQALTYARSTAWGEVVGYDRDQNSDVRAAEDRLGMASGMQTGGGVVIGVGLILVGGRFLVVGQPTDRAGIAEGDV